MNEVMTAHEVAEYLGLSVETIYRKARAGEIPAMRIGRRWRFFREALQGWLSREHQGTKGPGDADVEKQLPDFLSYHGGEIRGTLRRVEIYGDR